MGGRELSAAALQRSKR